MNLADPVRALRIEDLAPPPYGLILRIGAPIAAAAVVVGGLFAIGHHAGVASERPKVAAAQVQAAGAKAQGQLAAAAAAIPAAADRRALDITVHAEEAAHAVETALGAQGAVPAGVLSGWAAGVDGVRDEARAARAGADDPGGGEPARGVPAPAPAGDA